MRLLAHAAIVSLIVFGGDAVFNDGRDTKALLTVEDEFGV
jgi:hypothetical protein